jgi:ribosomal-protein-alanine acetyltransferase
MVAGATAMAQAQRISRPRIAAADHAVVLRAARPDDIDELVAIENECFDYDRLNRRNFHWMLNKANASLIVAEIDAALVGYVLVLYHAGTSLARLYSMAVLPQVRGAGIGRRLLVAAERAAEARDSAYMRLEVRPDNAQAIALYESNGYRFLEVKHAYYEDAADARRYEKRIRKLTAPSRRPVPFYAQHNDFTCGPAALMMAMGYLNPNLVLDERLELRLWREATTVFMMSGHGGCGPHGLALAAYRRGLAVRLLLNQASSLFTEGVRSEAKKRVIELVQRDFEDEIAKTDICVEHRSFALTELGEALDNGQIAIVLISAYQLTQSKMPHWVTITGVDEQYVYVHDPEVDTEHGKTAFDCAHVPIRREAFEKMTQFGSARLRATLVLSRRR